MATIYRQRSTFTPGSGGGVALVTTYWDSTGAAPAAMATEILARVRAAFLALGTTLASGSGVAYNTVLDEINEVTGDLVNQQSGTAPGATTFSGAGNRMPPEIQAVAQFLTGTFIAGRRLRGRLYIPGLTVGSGTVSGAPTGALVTAVNAFNAALGTTIITALNQRVWHRPVNGAGGLSAVVTSRAAAPTFAVLRSRRT
jgi:hypothetical protein